MTAGGRVSRCRHSTAERLFVKCWCIWMAHWEAEQSMLSW